MVQDATVDGGRRAGGRRWSGGCAPRVQLPPAGAPRVAVLTALLVALGAAAGARAGPRSPVEAPAAVRVASPGREPSGLILEDVTAAVGIDFRHFNGMTGNFTIAEITGQGGGVLDFDGDGDLDLYLVQGSLLGERMSEAVFPWKGPEPPRDRLLRNDLEVHADGRRSLRFVDVTAGSGILEEGYGMGVAAGDYDNDGRVDLYVTNLGGNRLYRNLGGGRFEDVTARTGTDDRRWSTCAAFLDYDRDGHLDLFVSNYVDFESDPRRVCYAASSARDFCGPKAYRGVPDRLLRNRGDGTFEDATAASGIAKEYGAGFGVVATDFNNDGWIDIYVANDGDPNLLWINQRDGTFRNEALWAGAAVDAEGRPQASMGVDAGDFDGDGDEDLFMTHIMQETNTLYVNDGAALFEDRTIAAGLAASSRAMTGFGTGFLDYDNDGWLDLVVLNGSVLVLPELARAGDPYPLGQANQLLHNKGRGTFELENGPVDPSLRLAEVSRGAVFGDIDNDGDTDLLVTNNNGPARLYLNRVGNRRHWLGLRLLVGGHERDALGARVEVLRDGLPPLLRRVHGDGSFCSTRDTRVLVGLGAARAVAGVRVTWPDGSVETFPPVPVDRYVTLRQGTAPGAARGRGSR